MRPSELRLPPITARARGQVRAGLRYVRTVPDLWIPLVMMTVVGTLTFNFSVVIPLFVTHTLRGDERAFTLLFSVLSAGSLMGALFTARRTSVAVEHVVVAAACFGLTMLAFAAAPTLALSFPIAVVVGFASISFMTASTAIVQIRSDPAMRGRVLALQAIVFLGSTPLGGPLLGALCDAYGARWGLAVGGVAALAAAGWGFLAKRRLPVRTVLTTPAAPGVGETDLAFRRATAVSRRGARSVPGRSRDSPRPTA